METQIPSPKRGHSPKFSAHVYCGQTAGWIKMPLGIERGLGPGNIVLDGNPATLPKKGAQPLNFLPMSIVAKRLDGSRCHSLGVDTDFILSSDPHTWNTSAVFQQAQLIVCSLTVISDAAEHSVALMSQFNQSIQRMKQRCRHYFRLLQTEKWLSVSTCRCPPASRH